ncbi:MAG: hypothetical protein QXK12_06060 [Candidatus Nezhaarchaeales archaeon]
MIVLKNFSDLEQVPSPIMVSLSRVRFSEVIRFLKPFSTMSRRIQWYR